jgi:hypothetical protein
MNKRTFLALAYLWLGLPALASAEEMAVPTGNVILTVTGAITTTNSDGAATFDLAMLEALPGQETTTKTPWYDGSQTFSGPLGSALLAAVGASGETLVVTAINDYVTEIPRSDFETWPVILAIRHNGEAMPVRDKGPIFVIYPFDSDNTLNSEVYYGRSAWQVKSIEVK